MNLSPLPLAFFVFSTVLSLGYGLFWAARPISAIRSALKSGSMVLLAAGFWVAGVADLLIWALLLCSLGDYFLSRAGERAFLFGMIAFAAGHLLYVPLFFALGAELNMLFTRLAVAAPLAVTGLVMARVLWHRTGQLRLPVTIYVGVILTMALVGLSLPSTGGLMLTMVGVGLFAGSDMILAFEKFVLTDSHPVRRYTPYAVWWSYWLAQVLIGAGVVLASE